MTQTPGAEARRVLIISHFAREEAIEASLNVIRMLDERGIVPVLEDDSQCELLENDAQPLPESVQLLTIDCEIGDCELVIVLGGDGTILRGVEIARPGDVPVLGVNLGHVGFLAESERDSLIAVIESVAAREYDVEERLAIDIFVEDEQGVQKTGWALNEASIEKGNRERMLDVVIDIDGEPLSSFGCDGVLLSTPTGSTAYSFSAGGPVVWPQVEAMLVVPVSAHALFAKPLVVAPDSVIGLEIHPRDGSAAVVWCDGRRSLELPSGTRITGTRSKQPVKLARLHQAPFTTRLVKKFQLPIVGWRGPR
ncbi:NAD kinase [Gulosibacter macacae]|uniref:NAD kinase n=1 Tax=Gulosibacter macacae TaxID=2488791 RepID=A0A3P3VSD7_9MICO|nr:NAD kinase [Gulosibacter macacae]RRJ85665.1 NAD kinase [Gulosibacter macacae]